MIGILANNIIRIGVANSISIETGFDPVDAIEYAKRHHFELVQIFLNPELLSKPEILERIRVEQSSFHNIYFHASGYFNVDFFNSKYRDLLYSCIASFNTPHFIIHFDENYDFVQTLYLAKEGSVIDKIYIENYFNSIGKSASFKNISRYIELFASNFAGIELLPVVDIPRFFHAKTGFSIDESLQQFAELITGISRINLPVLLHIIDCNDPMQSRESFCSVGEGYIPYPQIIDLLNQSDIIIEGIILEYEDKINPLSSRNLLEQLFREQKVE
ncbi:MAG: hypothetical protein A2Y62_08295 [Candidatus Fischerbacteria bacterium RBG_13_37_8]|uniref:Xylose isomerase-like TIM barrel domain-containing protein n=1 Tax=Candidatus Fischerbacteria bacterium RBG_13_37_8 TaxID=1817863 RepID=A0A1F5VX42_9BACT|nr:MAG: hypothetical protein A2Y62_08295 [Candidatus Fischerbacteria bacterium RBG_13_37_8]